MMMNGMSYGRPSPELPTPPAPPGMNMSMPQSDAQAVMGPEFTVKGDIGSDWMSSLSKWVNAHAYYPQAAVEQNQQGTAEVEFDVDRKGNVTGLRLLTSSGSTFLDQAWYGIFQGAKLPPFPANTKSDHVTVDYTIHYILGP
jgi:protein TonB